MSDQWAGQQPGADPGFRVDGFLPPGFDVLATLRQMYPGYTLARGTEIPLGSARITVTAEALRLDAPPPVAPLPPPGAAPAVAGAPFTPMPPGLSPQEKVAWARARMAQGGFSDGSAVVFAEPGTMTFSSDVVIGQSGGGTLDLASLLAAARSGNRDAVRSMVQSQLGGLTAGGPDSVRAHDPGFTEAGLIARAQHALMAVVTARAQGDARLCWRFLQAQLFDRERMQIELLAGSGRRQVVDEFQVLSAVIESVGGHAGGDHATVRMRIGGIAHIVDRKGKRVEGDRKYSEWHQRVMLQRGAGAVTGTGAGRCPTCEAAVADTAGACPGCGHPLPPSEQDWLVQTLLPREPAPRR